MGKSSKTRRPYGSGSIRRRGDGVWEVEVCHGRRSDGRRRMASRVVRGTRAEAEAELVRLRVEMGSHPNMGDAMTLREYFEGVFVPTRRAVLAPRTLETYESVWRTHIAPALGDVPADSIGRADVQRWVASLPSPACADKAYRHLRLILRAMWDDELLDEEPLRRHVRLPRHQTAPKDVWTPEELSEALERLRGHQMEALVLAMAGGGLRREEALALDLPGDLSFATVTGMDGTDRLVCRLVVRESWTTGSEQRPATKTYRIRPVTIGEPFASRLREVVSDGRPKLLMSARLKRPRPLRPASVCEAWERAFREPDEDGEGGGPLHGMRRVELKTLRHCHETLVAGSGFSDSVNANLHGHSQPVMYSHYLTVASAEADAMADAVRGTMAVRCGEDVG